MAYTCLQTSSLYNYDGLYLTGYSTVCILFKLHLNLHEAKTLDFYIHFIYAAKKPNLSLSGLVGVWRRHETIVCSRF